MSIAEVPVLSFGLIDHRLSFLAYQLRPLASTRLRPYRDSVGLRRYYNVLGKYRVPDASIVLFVIASPQPPNLTPMTRRCKALLSLALELSRSGTVDRWKLRAEPRRACDGTWKKSGI
jgi:hypothetical protein